MLGSSAWKMGSRTRLFPFFGSSAWKMGSQTRLFFLPKSSARKSGSQPQLFFLPHPAHENQSHSPSKSSFSSLCKPFFTRHALQRSNDTLRLRRIDQISQHRRICCRLRMQQIDGSRVHLIFHLLQAFRLIRLVVHIVIQIGKTQNTLSYPQLFTTASDCSLNFPAG